jgi:hypothetical protein
VVQGQPGQIVQDPTSKITRTKWSRGVAQVVEHLLYKCEALSSNPNPMGKKKKEDTGLGSSSVKEHLTSMHEALGLIPSTVCLSVSLPLSLTHTYSLTKVFVQ